VGSDNITYTSLPGDIQVDELRNPDTDAGFYVVRQANSSSLSKTSFDLDLRVWNGNVTVPVTLNGRVGFWVIMSDVRILELWSVITAGVLPACRIPRQL
jgi:hypothetical protein